MYTFFVEPFAIEENRIYITGNDVNHIKNVLRMKPGEELSVKTGADNKEYRCGIMELSEDEILCELRFIKEEDIELCCKVSLYQGLPKADKMEMIIQKAVELGVCEIIPVAMKRCVVRLDEKKAAARVARWQSIAEAAAKQSKRGIIPKVCPVLSFEEAVKKAAKADVPLLPYEMAEDISYTKSIMESIKPGESISVMIGPEGGFDEREIEAADALGMKRITLGKRILRTETAGMTVLSILMYELEGRGEEK